MTCARVTGNYQILVAMTEEVVQYYLVSTSQYYLVLLSQ